MLKTSFSGRNPTLCPNAGTQLSSSMVQPQNPNCLVGPQLLNTMVGSQLLNTMVRPQLLNTMVRPELLNTMVGTQLQLSASMTDNPTTQLHGGELNSLCPNSRGLIVYLHSPQSTPNYLVFQNPPILRTIASGHEVIHTPASFPFWDLLWQLCLSYPLRSSVSCTRCYVPELRAE